MTDYMAQMLNELMGPQRDAAPGESNFSFESKEVCKDYLVDFCANELFRNTKNDLGFCDLLHDKNLKEKYEQSSKKGRLGYEEKFIERIRRLHRDVQVKIDRNQRRVEAQGSGESMESERDRMRREVFEKKIAVIQARIEEKMEAAEKAGADGNITGAQKAVDEADELRKEKETVEQEEQKAMGTRTIIDDFAQNTAMNRQMIVCAICGCFQLANDVQQRIDDHLSGKLHLAYERIRNKLVEWDEAIEKRRKEREHRDKERHDKDKERRDKDRRRSRSRSPRKDRDRHDRDRRDRDRDRERSDRHRDDRDRRRDRDSGSSSSRRDRDRRH